MEGTRKYAAFLGLAGHVSPRWAEADNDIGQSDAGAITGICIVPVKYQS